MQKPIVLTSQDAILSTLQFKPFRSVEERRVEHFLPDEDAPQTMEIVTPSGDVLTAQKGDYIVSEIDDPDNRWVVNAKIFEETYKIVRPGRGVKTAITYLVPLTDVTGGDEDQEVTISSLEGSETVRAGDWYLARGVKGEIWPYPKEKKEALLIEIEEDEE